MRRGEGGGGGSLGERSRERVGTFFLGVPPAAGGPCVDVSFVEYL